MSNWVVTTSGMVLNATSEILDGAGSVHGIDVGAVMAGTALEGIGHKVIGVDEVVTDAGPDAVRAVAGVGRLLLRAVHAPA
jgi:hypothetical protein